MDEQPQGQADNLTALAQAAPELRPELAKKPLTAAEKLLLKNVSSGDEADCSELDDEWSDREHPGWKFDPEHADKWTDRRQIRAELLAWLCINQQARKQVHPRGIQVYWADVTGKLDLSFVNVPFQLGLQRCQVRERHRPKPGRGIRTRPTGQSGPRDNRRRTRRQGPCAPPQRFHLQG